jgi:hypothetical protein
MGAMETVGPPEDAGMPELGGNVVDCGVEVPDERGAVVTAELAGVDIVPGNTDTRL